MRYPYYASFKDEMIGLGNRLLQLPNYDSDLIFLLRKVKGNLDSLCDEPPTSMYLHPISEALIAKDMVRYSNIDVNILVTCCICEIFRITKTKTPYNDEQVKEFFELAVTTFENLSCASGRCHIGFGGCRTGMGKVIDIFRAQRLPVLMLNLRLDRLVVRLFKHFITVADSNGLHDVLAMERVMTSIIEESEKYELTLELLGLLVTSQKKENLIASPICWQLGAKVLNNCANRLKPHLSKLVSEMGIALHDYSITVASICNRDSEDESMKAESDDESSEEESSSDDEAPQHKKSKPAQEQALPRTLSSDDPPITSKSVTEVKGKHKRNNTPSQEQSSKVNANRNVSSPQSNLVCVHGYNVKQNVATIIEAIFKKHGDITSQCLFQTAYTREHFLDLVCEVVRQIQSNDVISMQEIERNILDAEAAKVNVSWLRAHLETTRKFKEIMKTKKTTYMVKEAAQMDLKERCAALLDAQEQFVKAKRCVKVLDLVKKKLNKNIVESIALVKKCAQKDLRERCAELVNVQERFEKTEMCVKVLHLVDENLHNLILKSTPQKDLLVEHDI